MMRKKNFLLFLLVGMIFSMMTIAQAFSFPITEPIILTFGNSPQVESATSTLENSIGNAIVIKYKDLNTIVNANIFMRAHSELIIVGHGNKLGIIQDNGSILSWKSLSQWINGIPFTKVDFLSCDSISATKLINVQSIGFIGSIDSQLGAYWIAITDLVNTNKFTEIFQEFITRSYQLLSKQADPSLLGGLVSGMRFFATRFGYDTYVSSCVFGFCVVNSENIMWVDAYQPYVDAIRDAAIVFGGGYVLNSFVTFLKGNSVGTLDAEFTALANYAYNIWSNIGTDIAGYGIPIEFYEFTALIIFVVCAIEFAGMFAQNQQQRSASGYDDYLMGLGAVYLPIPNINLLADGANYGIQRASFPMSYALGLLAFAGPLGALAAAVLVLSPIIIATIFSTIATIMSWCGWKWLGY